MLYHNYLNTILFFQPNQISLFLQEYNVPILSSVHKNIPNPKDDPDWNKLVIDCIKLGSNATVKPEFYLKFYSIIDLFDVSCFNFLKKRKNKSILKVANKIGFYLHNQYHDFPICKKMSPNMKKIELIDYNSKIRQNFKILLKKN